MPVIPFASVDLKNLSEAELEIVVQVIQKDFELKASEKARLRRHQRQLKNYDKRVSILASSNFNERFCVICFEQFFFVFVRKRCCYSCRHSMCNGCSVWIPLLKAFICRLCQKERNLKSMGCDWYYGLLKNRFQQDGSEIVAQSLYNNQGQYSIITPDLLRKVKGAQISRYRQKINTKWEEMQHKLNQLDRNDSMKSKKDEAWYYLVEEYKNYFKEILKEFSQYLYITLENYAAKVDDPSLNINEQVITTVYDEIELMIGYKINYVLVTSKLTCLCAISKVQTNLLEEIGSIQSDVESTTSMFIGNQMEEKLASALVNKIIQDHSLIEFNENGLHNFNGHPQPDEELSTSYPYHEPPYDMDIINGTVSGRSSTITSSFLGTEQSIEITKDIPRQYPPQQRTLPINNSESTLEDMNDPMNVSLTLKELKNIIRYSNSDNRSQKQQIERIVNVPYGEPIKLQFRLYGISDIETTWTMTNTKRTVVLYNTNDTDITTTSETNSITFYLKKWQTTGTDGGIYIASISNQPIVEFRVNIIVNNKKLVRPSFRLKMLNCSCRTSQIGEFSVEALGYPEPRVRFYFRNQLISTLNENYKIEYKEQISRYTLKILNVTGNDQGIYKCVANNGSGFCECSAQLQVANIQFRFGIENEIVRSNSSNSSVEEDVMCFSAMHHNHNHDIVDNASENIGGPLNETSGNKSKSPNTYKNPNMGNKYSPSNTMKNTSNSKDYQTTSPRRNQGYVEHSQMPSPKKNQTNVEHSQMQSPKKNQTNVEHSQMQSPKKNQTNVKHYQGQSPKKIQINVGNDHTTSPKHKHSDVEDYQMQSPKRNQTSSTNTSSSYQKNYTSPTKTKEPQTIHNSKTQSLPRDYPKPNVTKSSRGDYSDSNTMKSPSNPRENPSGNFSKNQDQHKTIWSPNTVVGREIPDEFRTRDNQQPSRSPRSAYSLSTENLDMLDSPSKISRIKALETSRYSLGGSNSNISRLKQLFEQPEFPTVQRNSSITGRTPRPDSRSSQSQFTKEVRVLNYD